MTPRRAGAEGPAPQSPAYHRRPAGLGALPRQPAALLSLTLTPPRRKHQRRSSSCPHARAWWRGSLGELQAAKALSRSGRREGWPGWLRACGWRWPGHCGTDGHQAAAPRAAGGLDVGGRGSGRLRGVTVAASPGVSTRLPRHRRRPRLARAAWLPGLRAARPWARRDRVGGERGAESLLCASLSHLLRGPAR